MWSTPNYVYGGFLRDLVVGGLSHATMDLDVGVRTSCSPSLLYNFAAVCLCC